MITMEQIAANTFLAQIGWSQRALATLLKINEARVRRMLNGVLPMDPEVFHWLKTLAEFHAHHPPPRLEPLRKPKPDENP